MKVKKEGKEWWKREWKGKIRTGNGIFEM